MKQLLFTLMLLFIGGVEISVQASNKYTIIELSQNNNEEREIPERGNEPGNSPVARGVIQQAAYAYLCDNVVSIVFQEAFSSATITIINETTGEAVYSETYNNPATLNIDLNGKSSGTYLIQIEADDTYLEGNFAL